MSGPGRGARGLSLDTGALIALEKGDPKIRALLREALFAGLPIAVVAPVVAQAWRGGPRQARISRLLSAPEVDVVSLDAETALAVGALCGRTGHADVVDVHVALHAWTHRHVVASSDPDDLRRVVPQLSVVVT